MRWPNLSIPKLITTKCPVSYIHNCRYQSQEDSMLSISRVETVKSNQEQINARMNEWSWSKEANHRTPRLRIY